MHAVLRPCIKRENRVTVWEKERKNVRQPRLNIPIFSQLLLIQIDIWFYFI